jgi:predicted DNA-binding transcriptional regulator AlpA
MSSKIEIQKICQFCNEKFIAKTTVTKFCSDKCSKRAYKQRTKKEKIDESNKDTLIQLNSTDTSILKNKEYLTPTNTALLLGVSRATMYRYLADNIIKCVVMRGKTFIRRQDIETLFDNAGTYQKRICKDRAPITEFYTIGDIKKKYNLKESWIYKKIKEKNIPKMFHRGKNLYSKGHIDKIFADKKADIRITEWYSVEEAMAKFNLTRDMLYHYVTFHKIPKIKEGRYIKISKEHLDEIFEQPIIL